MYDNYGFHMRKRVSGKMVYKFNNHLGHRSGLSYSRLLQQGSELHKTTI